MSTVQIVEEVRQFLNSEEGRGILAFLKQHKTTILLATHAMGSDREYLYLRGSGFVTSVDDNPGKPSPPIAVHQRSIEDAVQRLTEPRRHMWTEYVAVQEILPHIRKSYLALKEKFPRNDLSIELPGTGVPVSFVAAPSKLPAT